MEYHGKVEGGFCPNQAEAEQRRARQLEHHRLPVHFPFHFLVGKGGFFRFNVPLQIGMGDHLRAAVLAGLNGTLHGGMGFHGGPDGLRQPFFVGFLRHFQQEGDIVFVAGFVHAAFQINAQLGLGQRRGGDFLLRRFFLSGRTALPPMGHQGVFNVQDAHALEQLVHIGAEAEFFFQLHHQLHGGNGGKPGLRQNGGNTEIPVADHMGADLKQLLLQVGHFPRDAAFLPGLLPFRLGQLALVHFLVLVQGNGVQLHDDGGHHVRWFALADKGFQRAGGDGFPFFHHDVRGNVFAAAAFVVKGLHGHIRDGGILPDDGFDFGQLDAEAPDLHLSVTAADEVDFAVGQIPHHIAGVVHPVKALGGAEGIGRKALGVLFGAVQVSAAHTAPGNP